MNLFKSIFGRRVPNSEQVMEQAIALAQQGDAVEALTMMKQCVAEVREACGAQSLKYAQALCHQGTLAFASGDPVQGSRYCVEAADSCPETADGKKERLTYLMNAGQFLAHSGNADQAIPILQNSLNERISFYGHGHAGVAYGQQVLAEAMLADGQYQEGLKHATDAEAIFEAERHQEFPGTFALRTALASAAGQAADNIWHGLADYPSEVVDAVISYAGTTAGLMQDRLGLVYIEQLSDWCDKYMSDDVTLRINMVVTWSNLSSDRNDVQGMAGSADKLMALIDAMPDPATRIQLLQGMALNYSRCEQPEEKIRDVYQRAAGESEVAELTVEGANIARNRAIFEAEHEQFEAALSQYDTAIELSQQAGSDGTEILGRSMIAKGIFLQHQDRADEAKSLLNEGIAVLPATHSDAACGVLHLVALENGLSCCCDGGEGLEKESLSILANKFFQQSGLSSLLESVAVGKEGGLEVQLSRKPTEEELERLQVAHQVFMNQLGG